MRLCCRRLPLHRGVALAGVSQSVLCRLPPTWVIIHVPIPQTVMLLSANALAQRAFSGDAPVRFCLSAFAASFAAFASSSAACCFSGASAAIASYGVSAVTGRGEQSSPAIICTKFVASRAAFREQSTNRSLARHLKQPCAPYLRTPSLDPGWILSDSRGLNVSIPSGGVLRMEALLVDGAVDVVARACELSDQSGTCYMAGRAYKESSQGLEWSEARQFVCNARLWAA